MRSWTPSAGLIFLAAWSVYAGQANVASAGAPAGSTDSPAAVITPDVKVLPDGVDSTADSATTQPSETDSDLLKSTGPAKVTLTDAGTFSIQINSDISIVQVLRMIGSQAQISIIPSKEVRGTVPAMDLYNVTVSEALDAILQTNDMHWQQKGNIIFVYSQNEWNELIKASHHLETRVFRLYYTPASDARDMIKDVLSQDGKADTTRDAKTGIDSSGAAGVDTSGSASADTGGNSYSGEDLLVVTDYPENLDRVAEVLKQVDHRPQQVLVEATILDTQLNTNNAMGIDFSVMGGVNMSTILNNNTTVSNLLSGTVLNPNPPGNTNASIVKNGYNGMTTGNFDTQVPPGGLQIGVVKNNLGLFLQALETATNATVLANPKVLVLDKQSGRVHVGQELGYNGGTTVTQTSTTSAIAFLDTGTILSFRPFIGSDGYIRMEIHPEDSSGSVDTTANPPLPNKSVTEVTSNVMVKDGNTILIGGLFREDDQAVRNQVPLLGNLPWIGALFRSRSDTVQRHEVIILLTPHIVKDDQAYGRLSEEELKEIEKIRIGARKGMMWSGRDRLAESAYEDAVAEINSAHPNLDRAIWDLDRATNLNPTFPEAIDLKEKLTGKLVTGTDSSTVRWFVRQAIMEDIAPPAPPSADLPDLPPDIEDRKPTVSAATRPGAYAPSGRVAASGTTHPN
jgi:type IV pilus assembly protein PilQ